METSLYRPPDRSKYLLSDEIARLLDGAKKVGEVEYRFLKFSANTGVRPSEANQVKASDVHADEHRVSVNTIKQKNGKHFSRDVDLGLEYSKELGAIAKKMKPRELIFPTSRWTFWRAFRAAAAKAKLPDTYTLYSLRHSRAIYLLEWTGDLQYVSKQMGHSSLNVTSVYLHCLPSKRNDYVMKRLKSF